MSSLKSKYKILLSLNLVIEYHVGFLDGASYINFKKELLSNPNFKSDLNHLIHFKQVEFGTSKNQIQTFVDFMNENIERLGNRKIAFLTNSPNQVVITTLYNSIKSNLSQTAKIFSTKTNAFKWLNIPEESYPELNSIILELGKQFK